MREIFREIFNRFFSHVNGLYASRELPTTRFCLVGEITISKSRIKQKQKEHVKLTTQFALQQKRQFTHFFAIKRKKCTKLK